MATNYQEVENYGVESSFRAPSIYIDSNWFVHSTFSHTFTQSTIFETTTSDDALVGQQLIYVPKHQFNAAVTLSAHKWWLRYQHTFTDRLFITADNQWYLPAYDLANLSLTGRWNKGPGPGRMWTLRLEVNNLYNKQYQALPWRPMPGRWYAVSIRYRWLSKD